MNIGLRVFIRGKGQKCFKVLFNNEDKFHFKSKWFLCLAHFLLLYTNTAKAKTLTDSSWYTKV